MATTLHLVRHAAHGLLGRVLAGRMPGVALSAEGEAQAGRLAQHLTGRPIRAVVSSPMLRAQQTAAPIAAAHGLPVVTDPGFDEIDFGDWMGLPFDVLDGRPDWQAWNAFRSTAVPPRGESMLAIQARALDAAEAFRRAHPDAEVVIVGHQDVLKALLAHWLGAPLDLFHRIEVAPASRSIVVLADDYVRVDGVNLPP
ncbi:MAG: histidine phosphatase family protein [Gemmatimonadaceae bacterium]|nr:histidine phosphatase family protein [Acetobacteraceae bacterium]